MKTDGVASMRPGQKCPGKHRRLHASPIDDHGFNEAGAEMPRKTPLTNPNLFS